MSKIFKYIKMFLRVFYWPIYFLSGFFPRDKSIWVFGSLNGKRFADNPKYLFLDLVFNEKGSDIKPIWITRDKKVLNYLRQQNLPAYFLYSFKGIYYCLRAKVWIYDHKSHDISYWLSNGSIKINLWHGIPLKKIEWDSKIYKYYNLSGIRKILTKMIAPWIYEKQDYIISPADITDKIFISAFKIEEKNLIRVGYPRVKALLYPNNFHSKNKINFLDKKIIMYAPTYRDKSNEEYLLNILDFDKLNNFLSTNNLVMLIKPHPSSKLNIILKNMSFMSIFNIDAFEDIYEHIPFVDLLITDYSSIYYDFLYKNKPIIFFPYDLETYTKMDRDLYYNYEEYTPGPKVFNLDQLINEIKNVLHDDEYSCKRKEFIKKIGLRDIYNTKKEILKVI